MKRIMRYTLSGGLLVTLICVPVVGSTFEEGYLKKQEQEKRGVWLVKYMTPSQYVRDLNSIHHREYRRLDRIKDASLINSEEHQKEIAWMREREKELIHKWELAGMPKGVVPSQGLFRRYNLVHADIPNGSVSNLGILQPTVE